MPKLNFFVVRPIHARSDYVVQVYVEPACQDAAKSIGQESGVIAAGDEASAAPITVDIFRHLQDDEFIVAYLGRPARMSGAGNNWFWNPNVMLEAGYRMGLGRPILFVRDAKIDNDEPLLPFDLNDQHVVQLPTEEEERNNPRRIRETVAEMTELIRAGIEIPAEQGEGIYPAPAISYVFDKHGARVTSASKDAAEFFGFPPGELRGKSVQEMVDMINSRILQEQRDAFSSEQVELIGKVFTGQKPYASVCLVFDNQAITQDSDIKSAYLPIVTQFERQSSGSSTLNVLYLDVTQTAKLDPDGVIRCQLGRTKKAGG